MAAYLPILVLLAGCRGEDSDSSESNPFDDWGPYKGCHQDIVYTDYDQYDPNAGPYPGGETVNVYTAQGGLLQRDEYGREYDGTEALWYTTYCSYDDGTHAPLGCDTFYVRDWKRQLYSTDTYAYRADGLLAWESRSSPNWYIIVLTTTRDESDRIIRIDAAAAPTDKNGAGAVAGVPYGWDVWIYDADSTLPIDDGASAIPSEIDSYENDQYGSEYLTGVVRYTVDNDEIVRREQLTSEGDVYEFHDYTYDDDGHLLTDVRDGGWETYTLAWDGDFLMTETHELAWKELADVRINYVASATYDCEAP